MRKQMKCAAAYKRALWEPEERGDEGWEEEGDVEGVGDGNVVGGGVRGRMGVVVGRVRSGSEMRVGAATDRRRETAACKRPVVSTFGTPYNPPRTLKANGKHTNPYEFLGNYRGNFSKRIPLCLLTYK
ncbi:hypothetical protein BWQ96_07230 [Gracilariopsis chorda]|uniref:Uncharacterized protein n=1 Tax=Gracilariopsis chorda TaxID=448386 RepID=A0A2V3ILU9_9FLOR|nr:hypothetical protein BWQ96_07230 [Gracilariopsis chorda]|eukprot:PXF43033.1 hypothetical protein BWQ96_07230 [Gracilariopsis chorda]